MIRWFGGEDGYSDAEIRAMVRRIETLRPKRETAKEEAAKPATKLVKVRKKLKKAA